MPTSLTSELEAVNFLLKTIGESPVNDIDNPQLADAVAATTCLRQVSKREQTRGYHFNTDENYKLLASANQFIVPNDCLRIDPVRTSASIDAVQRGTKLWDRKNHTYTFTQPSIFCDIVRHYPWDELPEACRQHFMYQATSEFYHDTFQADPETAVQKGIFDAQAVFEEFVSETGDHSALYSSFSTWNALRRDSSGVW